MAIGIINRICDNCGESIEYTIKDPDINVYDGWALFPLGFICQSCVSKFDPRQKTGYELWKTQKEANNELGDEII